MRRALRLVLTALLISFASSAHARPTQGTWHFGVLSDPIYTCPQCYRVLGPAIWETFAKQRDPNSVIFNSLAAADWMDQLDTLDILILPMSYTQSHSLNELSQEAKDRLRAFVYKGGLIVSQNSLGGTQTANMAALSKLFDWTYAESSFTTAGVNASVTEAGLMLCPALPATVPNNFRVSGYKTLDPHNFHSIYAYQGIQAVATASYGLGSVILFGLAQDQDHLGLAQEDVLDALIQVTKVPVF